ncbi:hypothetical protein ATM97_13080 [Nocardia sp. MH4]|uniref:hypothetical protein n=1 Tax=Nocardia sp. MH4 TaxID=1768677 RepID=UPI001C4FEEB7|nr:hypothetical protein [Nocardia sp. MH4]MBW0271685.1 hypothetical protein [Nocardia sp. MH4]
MGTREWIAEKVEESREATYKVHLRGEQVLVVERTHGLSPATVLCLERSPADFTAADLDAICTQVPEVDFVVGTRSSPIAHQTYHRADMLGIGIGSLGDLLFALRHEDVASARTKERVFVENGFAGHTGVESFGRIAKRAYEIVLRAADARTRRVVITKEPELSAEEVSGLVAEHRTLALDSIASSNPATRGFGPDARDTACSAGVALFTWKSLLADLAREAGVPGGTPRPQTESR